MTFVYFLLLISPKYDKQSGFDSNLLKLYLLMLNIGLYSRNQD